MALKLRTPDGERTAAALLTILWGGAFCWIGFRFPVQLRPVVSGWMLVVAGMPLVASGVLLWLRRGWIRWPSSALLTLLALAQMGGIASWGFGWGRLFILLGLVWTAFDVFRHFSPHALASSESEATDGESGPRPMISLALLLRRPRHLDAQMLARYCEGAWGGEYRVLSSGDSPRPPARDEEPGWVTGRTPVLIVGSPDGVFVVHNHDRPYFGPRTTAGGKTPDVRLRQVLQENRAWIAVDLMASTQEGVERNALYAPVARLIAVLAGPDCQAIYRPETGQFSQWDESLEERLRGPDVLALFEEPAKPPVNGVLDSHPRM